MSPTFNRGICSVELEIVVMTVCELVQRPRWLYELEFNFRVGRINSAFVLLLPLLPPPLLFLSYCFSHLHQNGSPGRSRLTSSLYCGHLSSPPASLGLSRILSWHHTRGLQWYRVKFWTFGKSTYFSSSAPINKDRRIQLTPVRRTINSS